MAQDSVPVRVDDTEAAWAPKRCAWCGAGFQCGADTPSCWCDRVQLSEAQRAHLAELRLVGCLCPACLEAL